MVPSEKTEPDAPNPKNDAIHKHLRTQFYGVFTKLTQEIDPIIKRKEDLQEDLEDLKELLKDACEQYSKNIEMGRAEAIEHFCKDCHQAINSYKKSPGGYPSLARNGIARETMDNILNRFSNGIQTAIDYTRLPCATTPEVVPPALFEALKAKFGLAKIDKERRNDTEEEHAQKPS